MKPNPIYIGNNESHFEVNEVTGKLINFEKGIIL